jgi:leucyl/phenylalanyl-tRNA---protein transferase
MPSERPGSSGPPGDPGRSPGGPLTTRYRFPPAETADSDGFLAMGGDLKPGTLLLAYGNGIFPWTTNPITWWSPDPRAIIPEVHVSRSFARFMRKPGLSVTFDRAFRRVMEECARPRPGRKETWISPQFITAYTRLHDLGHAHSAEVWRDSVLVGGLYGVSIGSFFAGESMFSAEENGSKVALAAMDGKLRACGFQLFDVQMMTPHLESMGAATIPRAEYLRRLRGAVATAALFTPGEATPAR